MIANYFCIWLERWPITEPPSAFRKYRSSVLYRVIAADAQKNGREFFEVSARELHAHRSRDRVY